MQVDSHSREQNRQPRHLFSSISVFIHELSGLSIFLGHICHSVPCVLSVLAREMSFLLHKPPVERSAIIQPAEDESAATTCSTECPQEFTQQQQKMSVHGEHDDKVVLSGLLATSTRFRGIGGEQLPRKQLNHKSRVSRNSHTLALVCDRDTNHFRESEPQESGPSSS